MGASNFLANGRSGPDVSIRSDRHTGRRAAVRSPPFASSHPPIRSRPIAASQALLTEAVRLPNTCRSSRPQHFLWGNFSYADLSVIRSTSAAFVRTCGIADVVGGLLTDAGVAGYFLRPCGVDDQASCSRVAV